MNNTPPVPPQPPQTPTPPPMQPPMPVNYAAPAENPGQGFGIAGLVLGLLSMWLIGLPLSIVSISKSKNAQAPTGLGVAGLIINIFTAIASLIIGSLFAIGFFVAIQEGARTSHDTTTETTTVDTSSQDVSLEQSYDGASYWGFPVAKDGWRFDVFDKNGFNKLVSKDEKSYYMSYQGVESTYDGADSDREASELAIKDYLKSGGADASGSTYTMTFKELVGGKKVEFLAQRYTYKKDGVTYKGNIAIRAFNSKLLMVTYAAPVDTYRESEWIDFSAVTYINDKGL